MLKIFKPSVVFVGPMVNVDFSRFGTQFRVVDGRYGNLTEHPLTRNSVGDPDFDVLAGGIIAQLSDSYNDHAGVVTDIWSREFIQALLGKGVKPHLFVGWKISGTILDAIEVESGGDPRNVADMRRKFFHAENFAERVFDHVVWLSPNMTFHEAVMLVNGTWTLTSKGKGELSHD
jgi:hypothetical protein